MGRRPSVLISGNWKMHLDHLEAIALVARLSELLKPKELRGCRVSVHPPFTAIRSVQAAIKEHGAPLLLGAQNCFWEREGPFTGEVSPVMLARLDVALVIVGHSERRRVLGETDEMVARKARAVLELGMGAIVCVGETMEERKAGQAKEVVARQLRGSLSGLPRRFEGPLVVAYEPVWAIGTGESATSADIAEMAAFIRRLLPEVMGSRAGEVLLQYGGSVSPENAKEILAIEGIDGALVGSASLSASAFAAIVRVAVELSR
jgi:triosephosphate isomerase